MQYIELVSGSTSCPVGYQPVSQAECAEGVIINGVTKKGSAQTFNNNKCFDGWPSGCFVYGSALLFSTCSNRPLSIGTNLGVCRTRSGQSQAHICSVVSTSQKFVFERTDSCVDVFASCEVVHVNNQLETYCQSNSLHGPKRAQQTSGPNRALTNCLHV